MFKISGIFSNVSLSRQDNLKYRYEIHFIRISAVAGVVAMVVLVQPIGACLT